MIACLIPRDTSYWYFEEQDVIIYLDCFVDCIYNVL